MTPYPDYKPSGVAWLGDVPAHWEVKRLRFLVSEPLMYGANAAADNDDPTLTRFVRITDIADGDVLREDTFRSLPDEIARPYLLEEGDLLFARSGSVGKVFRYRKAWGNCCFAGYLIRARLDNREAKSSFVRYYTDSVSYWSWVNAVGVQATILNISADKYADLPVPTPPVEEQAAIAAWLDGKTAQIDALVSKTEAAIERLREWRAALVTAAVTGQIDVREPRA